MKTEKNMSKLAMAGAIVGTAVLAGIAGAYMFPNEVDVPVPVLDELAYTAALAEGAESVIIPVCDECITCTVCEPEVITNIVEVDNENLQLVLDTIYEKDGNVTYLLEGLYDDEVDEIVERIVLVNEIETLSADYVITNFATELEKFNISYDKRDIYRVKVDTDTIKFVSQDFKYEDFVLEMEVEFRYEGATETKIVSVDYYNGRVRNLKFI